MSGQQFNPFDGKPEDFAAIFQQLQGVMNFSVTDGWDLAQQIAISIGGDQDPLVSEEDKEIAQSSMRLADVWLEPSTNLPSGINTTGAWRKQDWISETIQQWRELARPLSHQLLAVANSILPTEVTNLIPNKDSLLASLSGVLLGTHIGQAVGALSSEVLSASDIGIPLAQVGKAFIVPNNVRKFGTDLSVPDDQLFLYVSLREAAYQRLFAHIPWLVHHVVYAVTTYAQEITVNPDAVNQALTRFDPTDGNSLEIVLGSPETLAMFTPDTTPAAKAALNNLETALALIEGWVSHVVEQSSQQLPAAIALHETMRRRRAVGGPAEQSFATLVGLELRPRKVREAVALWAAVDERFDMNRRDGLWNHPDFLPSSDDLSNPEEFLSLMGNDEFNISDLDDGDKA